MEKYKVDKQGKLKIRDKKKIFKILRLIYDICSAIFILFVCVGLIISSSPREEHNDSASQHIPNIQEKYREQLASYNGNNYINGYEFLADFSNLKQKYISLGGASSGITYGGSNTSTYWYNYLKSASSVVGSARIYPFGKGLTNYPQALYFVVFNDANSPDYEYVIFTNKNNWSSSSRSSGDCYVAFVLSTNNGLYEERGSYYSTSSNVSYPNGTSSYLKASTTDTAFSNLYNEISSVMSGYTESDLSSAYNSGYSSGYDVGYDEGHEVGYDEGYIDGQSNIAPIDSQLIISSDYDFRGLVTQQIDSATGLMRVSESSGGLTEITNLDLKGLTFKVEDNVYNEIRISYISLDANNTIYDSVNLVYKTAQQIFGNDYVYYRGLIGVYYRYVENGTITKQVQVFEGLTYDYKDDNGTSLKGFNYTTTKWSNGVFRTIIIVSDTGDKQTTPSFSNSFSTYELLKLNGSQLIHIDNNVFNVFSLLTQAFNSVGGILSIAIIPGISIGLLMFIPLIVTIILFIIHMIKK